MERLKLKTNPKVNEIFAHYPESVREKMQYLRSLVIKTAEEENVSEFCYSATLEEVEKKDFSLVPSKYIEFVNRDENIDFDEKMTALKGEFTELLKAEAQSKNDLLNVFKELGYEISLEP